MNRTGRRDKKQLENYQKTCTELTKLKQEYNDLKHQCAEGDNTNHRLTTENSKLTDLVKAMCDEVKQLQRQLALFSQAGENAKEQGLKEIEHEEHLCSSSTEDPTVCACGKALPIIDLSQV
jgi:predicted nuclease with TOPRIM domain